MMLAAAVLLGSAAASAQGWTLEGAVGGAVHDPLAEKVGSTTASLGVDYASDSRWGYAASGVPVAGGGPLWGAAGAGAWLARPLRGVQAGVSLGADAFGYGADEDAPGGGGVSGRVLPGVVLGRDAWRLDLGAGGTGMTRSEGDSTTHRLLAEAGARLAWASPGGALLGASVRYLHGEGESHPFAGVSAEVARERVSAWAEAGAWLGDSLASPRAALGVGGQLLLLPGTTLALSWRQEPSEPLFRVAPRRMWSLALRRALGAPPRAPGMGPAHPVAVVGREVVTFRLPRGEHPGAPSLLSDLTGWRPLPLRAEAQWWTVTVPARPGVHRYLFRTPQGGVWLPPAVPRESDGFGGFNAVLVIP